MYTGYYNYDLLFDETASAFHLVYRCPVIFHPAGAALIDGGDMSMTNVLVVDDDIAICRIVHRCFPRSTIMSRLASPSPML